MKHFRKHVPSHWDRDGSIRLLVIVTVLTLLPMGWGEVGFLARAIRLAARTLEPFHLESSKFLTCLLCLLDTLWRNFRSIDLPGELLQLFFEQEVIKNKGYEHLYFCSKWLKFIGGYNLGSGRQLLAIKVSFRINKSGFRRLISELATCPLLRRQTFMTSYL